jgi:hypothetical protein
MVGWFHELLLFFLIQEPDGYISVIDALLHDKTILKLFAGSSP